MIYLNHYLKEDYEKQPKKIRDVIDLHNGKLDIDVGDTEIDILVAFCYDSDLQEGSEYDRFMNILADNVYVDKLDSDSMICKFSEFFKPFDEQLKQFFDMDNSEFDEGYYEAVANLEALLPGFAGEEAYKELNDILEGKSNFNESDNFDKSVLDDFKNYLNDNSYSETDVDENIVNDYFTGLFYEVETDEDIEDMNRAEKLIRTKYKLNESTLNEDMTQSQLVERIKEGVIRSLPKAKTAYQLEGVLNYYLNYVQNYDFSQLKEDDEVKSYRYVTNHGTGPGTLPKDVNLIKSEDINSNGKVAIYIDRPLTKEELEKYDIKPEWIQEEVDISMNGDMSRGMNYQSENKITAVIYQIQDIENCKYAFMDYDFAKGKFNMNDYKSVASIDVNKSDNTDITLEHIFMLGNTAKDKFNVTGKFRSISVSDVIELDGKKYYVDSLGFKEVK